MAIDGEILVGGAPFATLNGVQQPGRAFVYELDKEGLWQHTQTLRPSIIQPLAFFGLELTAHGNTIAVSSIGEDDPRDRAGAVYVFEKSGGTWTQTQRVVPSDRNFLDLFGGGMSMNDNTLVIGSVGHATPSGSETGAAFIFERQAGVWTQSAMLYPAVGTPFGNFGFDSAIVGNTVVVGSLADDNRGFFRAGAVFVFELTGGGGWIETAKLIAPDPSERAELGMSVGMDQSGTTIVGGAPTALHQGVVTGAAYVFELIHGKWQLTAKLTAPDPASGAQFGIASAISGDTILVGAFLDSENGAGAGAIRASPL